MNPLLRLLELVHRTRLPVIVQPSDSIEPCVLIPLSTYEYLVGSTPAEGVGKGEPAEEARTELDQEQVLEQSLLEAMLSSVPAPIASSEEASKKNIQLQDFFQPPAAPVATTTPSPVLPQQEGIEDRFAFDGLDVRILPRSSKKSAFGREELDEKG